MIYLVLVLEGILTFISPCILPLMPVYLAYFMGEDSADETSSKKMLTESLLFVAGFSVVFILMGLFIAQIGTFLVAHRQLINIVTGLIVLLFGIDMLLQNRFASMIRPLQLSSGTNRSSSFVLGLTFAVSWTPCVGAFLASVYSLILNSGSYGQAALMLALYCVGLGIPFVLTAVLMGELKVVFSWLKRHHRTIQIASGAVLVALGVLMMTGHVARWLVLLS